MAIGASPAAATAFFNDLKFTLVVVFDVIWNRDCGRSQRWCMYVYMIVVVAVVTALV